MLLLWLINISLYFALSKIGSSATIFISFEVGLTLLIQREIVWQIAKQKFPEKIENN